LLVVAVAVGVITAMVEEAAALVELLKLLII
jgi:hypothetical protein